MECVDELIARDGWKDEVGVVRLSLGIGSDFEDVWKVVQWAKGLTAEKTLEQDQWKTVSSAKDAQASEIAMYALAFLKCFYDALVVLFSTSIY